MDLVRWKLAGPANSLCQSHDILISMPTPFSQHDSLSQSNVALVDSYGKSEQ